jgi:putative hydrolase of the HAD superfamily
MVGHVVLWDFDGTLAWREGHWASALVLALDELEPGHCVSREQLRPYVRDGFPWHRPERPHPELCEPEAWWAELGTLLARAFQGVGYDVPRSRELTRAARRAYLRSPGYQLFDDAIPALERLGALGWRHVILSNHVPELEDIVRALGVRDHFDVVLSSALIGYEKPHPEAFRIALAEAGAPTRVWMVGDNPVADVQGAESLGIPAILVRRESEARWTAPDLWGAAEIVIREEGASDP